MAEVFHPWGLQSMMTWIKNRVGSITNQINACAAHGAIKVATKLLWDFNGQFQCLPASIPGAFEYAMSHAQYHFFVAWAKVIERVHSEGICINDENAAKHSQNVNNRNLRVATCLGISAARQHLKAVQVFSPRQDDEVLKALIRNWVAGLISRTPLDNIYHTRDLLEIASTTGAVPVIEAVVEKSPSGTSILYNRNQTLYLNPFCSAMAGGYPDTCRVLLTAVPSDKKYNIAHFCTPLLKAACTSEKNFKLACKAMLDLVASTPTRWDEMPFPSEFTAHKWPPFEKSTIALAASLGQMWVTLTIILSPEFSDSDEEITRNLPNLLCNLARYPTSKEAVEIFSDLFARFQKVAGGPLPSWTVKLILESACQWNNGTIFQLTSAQPDFKAELKGELLSELLVDTLIPKRSGHFHMLFEDFIGLPKNTYAIFEERKAIHHYSPQPQQTVTAAAGLLPFLRAEGKATQQPGGTETFKMDTALVKLIQKGCRGEALLWLHFNDLFCWDSLKDPIHLFETVLRLRPESSKKGGTDGLAIGYRKLNKHIIALQEVLTLLAQRLGALDVEQVLYYKVPRSATVWPVTLFLLGAINSQLAVSAAGYVESTLTVHMLAEAVLVDLSVSGKYFSIDPKDRPSLFQWLLDVCTDETMRPVLLEFLHQGSENILVKHPDRLGVETFHRKASMYLRCTMPQIDWSQSCQGACTDVPTDHVVHRKGGNMAPVSRGNFRPTPSSVPPCLRPGGGSRHRATVPPSQHGTATEIGAAKTVISPTLPTKRRVKPTDFDPQSPLPQTPAGPTIRKPDGYLYVPDAPRGNHPKTRRLDPSQHTLL
ncbi:hypothetical protein Pelo_15161 [Pelomyxa schiedti]|nr:hypothetical protein Pelo_15161 [Pelomyxa schiedti]